MTHSCAPSPTRTHTCASSPTRTYVRTRTPAPAVFTRRTVLGTLLAFSANPALPARAASDEQTPASALGIILVGASWCPWCHGAAEQLHIATQQWGWPVLIASIDQTPIPPFESFIEAAEHPLAAGIIRLPTTLIVAPRADRIVSAFEGYRGPVPYLSRIATIFDAWAEGEAAHG